MRVKHLSVLALVALISCDTGNSPILQALQDYVLQYCGSLPLFVATQAQSGGAWTEVTLNGSGQATIQLGEKFGLATVHQNGTTYSTYITYVTKTELPSFTGSCSTTGTKTVNGSISTLSAGQEAQVNMDGSSKYFSAGGTTAFAFTGIRNGGKDVIAQRRVTSTGAEDKVIVVRSQDIANAGSLAQLNFASAATTASGAVTINGVIASETRGLYSSVSTVNNGYAFFNSIPAPTNTAGTVFGLPAASALATDVFGTFLYVNGTNSQRGVDAFSHTFGNVTLNVGPVLSTPTVTAVSTSPRKLKIVLPSQTEYGKALEFYYYQSTVGAARVMDIFITSAYLGGTPTNWDVQAPDLTGVAGYPTAAEFGTGTATWDVNVFGSTEAYFKNYVDVTDGTVVKWAYVYSSTPVSPSEASLRAPSTVVRAPLKRAMQAFGR